MTIITQDELARTWDQRGSAAKYARRHDFDLTAAGLHVGFCAKRKAYAFLPIPQDKAPDAAPAPEMPIPGARKRSVIARIRAATAPAEAASDAPAPMPAAPDAPPPAPAASGQPLDLAGLLRPGQVLLVIGTPMDAPAGRMHAGQLARKLRVPIWVCSSDPAAGLERIEPPAKGARRAAAGPKPAGARGGATDRMVEALHRPEGATFEELGAIGGWSAPPGMAHLTSWAQRRSFRLDVEGSGKTARYRAKPI